MGAKKNVIVEFVNSGKSLSSQEGRILLMETERSIIEQAAKDQRIKIALKLVLSDGPEPVLHRKLLLAMAKR